MVFLVFSGDKDSSSERRLSAFPKSLEVPSWVSFIPQLASFNPLKETPNLNCEYLNHFANFEVGNLNHVAQQKDCCYFRFHLINK